MGFYAPSPRSGYRTGVSSGRPAKCTLRLSIM
jgi:hypothetical protein